MYIHLHAYKALKFYSDHLCGRVDRKSRSSVLRVDFECPFEWGKHRLQRQAVVCHVLSES